MTAVLPPRAAELRTASPRGPVAAQPSAPDRPRRWSRLPAGWPIGLLVAAFPVWLALGVTALVLPLAAAILLVQLLRRGRLRVPPGFWLWLLFLAAVLVSAVMLDTRAPGTVAPSGFGRYVAYGFRLLGYAAVAVVMLYVGNTSERELPRLRVIRWMALLAVWTVALGLLSVALPGFGFNTPFSALLPSTLDSLLGGTGGRVTLSQLQPVLGVYSPRPAAPFAYTNAWGNTLSLLLVWLLVAGWAGGRRSRAATAVVLAVSIVPIVYSLNRGMWIGLGLSVAYVAVRLAARGRLLAIGALALALGLGTTAFLASPLQILVSERLANGHSNDIRSSLAVEALRAAEHSPLLGYGSTRQVIGSGASIAIGQTATCPKCGNADIGSTGQFFLLLVAQGFLGAALYVAYFLRTLWAYRRDASPIGMAGTLVVLLSLFYGIAYTALTMPLVVVFLSIALLWRNDTVRSDRGDTVRSDRGDTVRSDRDPPVPVPG